MENENNPISQELNETLHVLANAFAEDFNLSQMNIEYQAAYRGYFKGALSPIAKRIHTQGMMPIPKTSKETKGYITLEEHERLMKEFGLACANNVVFTIEEMLTQFKAKQ